jgi:maltooligosyltrehalose trehalohydrolase
LSETVGRPLTLIAESDQNDPRLCRPRGHGGYGLPAQWSDDFHHALHAVLTGEVSGYYVDFGEADGASSVDLLARALTDGWVFTGQRSQYRARRHGRPPDGISGANLLGYAQNHDQVGNRAVGDRLAMLVGDGRQRIAAALVLTSPFVPLLFQGEEWGSESPFQYFTDHQDRELGRAVAQGRRSEFGAFGWQPDDVPDPQSPATFERSRLDWSELSAPRHASMLEWYRELIALRRAEPALGPGPLTCSVEMAADRTWFRVDREGWSLAVNLAAEAQMVPCSGRVVLGSDPATERAEVDGELCLPPDSVAVVGPRRV